MEVIEVIVPEEIPLEQMERVRAYYKRLRFV